MPDFSEARNFIRRFKGLASEPVILRKAVERALEEFEVAFRWGLIESMLELAMQGDGSARSLLPAVMEVLHGEPLPSSRSEYQKTETPLWLQPAVALKEMPREIARKADSQLFSDSLGHLKQRARTTRDMDVMTRLGMLSEPSVVRHLLDNPRMTEALVLRMAARQPVRPEPLIEIWRSTRWSIRLPIRRALVQNPYLPIHVGVRLVPLLPTYDLKQIVSLAAVHSALKKYAAYCLETGLRLIDRI